MNKLIAVLFLTSNFYIVLGQAMDEDYQKVVSDFIALIKTKNKEKLANQTSFPFRRQYPIPAIKNKSEFMKRYNELFDDSLRELIVKSDPVKDWGGVGWRGIMFLNGTLWLDYDGKLIGVNSLSKTERLIREELIEKDRNGLHVSIKNYETPICILETVKYRIRIDALTKGNYRYSAWPIQKKMIDKPDIILENGEWVSHGSGGNHSYKFLNGDYVYECFITIMGEDDAPPAMLVISKSGKEILSQAAEIIKP